MWSPASVVVLTCCFVPTLGPANAVGSSRAWFALRNDRKVVKFGMLMTAKTAVLRL